MPRIKAISFLIIMDMLSVLVVDLGRHVTKKAPFNNGARLVYI